MFTVVLCCLLGMALGQGSSPCCTPDVWEGEYHSFAGYVNPQSEIPLTRNLNSRQLFAGGVKVKSYPQVINDHNRVLYDYAEKKLAYFYSTRYEDGTSTTYRYIGDYNAGKRYFIYQNECHMRTTTDTLRKSCISANATYYGDIYYGAGNHTLMAKRYYDRYHSRSGQDVGANYFTVTKDACVPVEKLSYVAGPGSRGLDIVRGGTYLNIVPEIRDRGDFVPPETCHMATEEEWARFEKFPGADQWENILS